MQQTAQDTAERDDELLDATAGPSISDVLGRSAPESTLQGLWANPLEKLRGLGAPQACQDSRRDLCPKQSAGSFCYGCIFTCIFTCMAQDGNGAL